MLKQRIITAVILIAVVLGALMAPGPAALMALLGLMAVCALWEWLRLLFPSARVLALLGAGLMAILILILSVQRLFFDGQAASAVAESRLMPGMMLLVVMGWLFGATHAVIKADMVLRVRYWHAIAAFVAVLAVWVALVQLYMDHGWRLLLSLMMLVWVADIAAYFCGKAFGRHKLAPGVSPGKTWEGACGGVVAATAWVLISMAWEGSFGAVLAQGLSIWLILLASVCLAALSIIGDLFESLLKRRTGVKDSSGLLPGHGGVFDRIDALLPVAPVAFLLIELVR